jgi:hypothetical protein
MKLELQSQERTEVYVSDSGYCCIKQDTAISDPVIVAISPDQVDALCRFLKSIKKTAISFRKEYLKQEDQQ